MNPLETLLSIGRVRKFIWSLWYPWLTRRLRGRDVTFLNYAFENDPPSGPALDPADEPNRASIQLYHHVASQVPLQGRQVLEVSCGHGGGASWIMRNLGPAAYTGLDLNGAGVKFCQERHRMPGLTFQEGDAMSLPFADASWDVVLNVEASHCYPDFTAFLREVARVLRPGGHFLYADFRFREEVHAWDSAISSGPLGVLQTRDISREVLRGMDRNAARSEALVKECFPRFLHPRGRDFAGVPGSMIYEALKSGGLSYRSWCMAK